jgi:ricin-type beta-trefoil lectin protein/fibronectin type III domain protein
LSAHRRSALRVAAGARRRPALVPGRRRARSRSYRLLPVVAGIGVLSVGALAGPGMVGARWIGGGTAGEAGYAVAALPKDVPDQGMVYDGLTPAPPGSLCAGSYQLDQETCTHGPDRAPAGLAVRKDVPPVTAKAPVPVPPARESGPVPVDAEIVRDEGGSALTPDAPALIPDAAPGEADFVMGMHDVACEGDGRSGKRVEVLYLHEFGTASRYTDFVGSIRIWSAGVDGIVDASAAETGGSRHVRFVTTPQCKVDVAEVQMPRTALASFAGTIGALQTLGYNRTDRKYLLFADANVYCGIGTYIADKRPGMGNRNNGGPSYGRVDAGCWSSIMAAHELTHTLGAILTGSPNASGAGGCTDDYDVLCGPDRSGKPMRAACPRKHETRLDCGHDDYFSTNPRPGSYLARNWNVAQSEFLLRGDGGADVPDAPNAAPAPAAAPTTQAPAVPAVPATPPSSPTPEPGASDGGGDAPPPSEETPPTTAPAPSGGAEQPTADGLVTDPAAARAAQAVLEVRDPTSTAVRLSWSAAAPTARYEVSVDGTPIATTVATRAQLIGLKPDTTYRVTVRNAAHRYTAAGSARTAPAARPAPNSWFVLTNSLTGGAADLYAARTASGTPVTLGESDGDAQQQWKLTAAGRGMFSLRSKATGECVVPLGGNPVAGAPLVQGDCSADSGPRWRLQPSDHGFTLRTAVGGLVVGVGAQRFGTDRVLVLQSASGARHQSWTAVPG